MMKKTIGMIALLAASVAAASDFTPNFNLGTHTLARPDLVPEWSGARPGVWTMDYESALANAQAEGKYTLMTFMGAWWCPHCQPLERFVYAKDEFKAYVAEKGYYLTMLDFPFRDGVSEWCWLWDPEYRAANIPGWTDEDVTRELIKRFEFQDGLTKGGAVTTNANIVVSIVGGVTNMNVFAEAPETVYHRVGYPTVIVIAPDGTEAGRFNFLKTIAEDVAVGYVIDNIELIKMKSRSTLFADPGAGGLLGAAAKKYDGWLADSQGAVSGTVQVKAAKANKKTKAIKLSATVVGPNGQKNTFAGTAAVSTNKVFTLKGKNPGTSMSVMLGENGLVGTCTIGGGEYSLQGAVETKRTFEGQWPVVLATSDNGGSDFARGYSGISAKVSANGKVKVSGYLGDGAKAGASAKVIVGEDGIACVPVVANMYSKKGGFGLLLNFQDGKLAAVDGVSAWRADKKPATFTARWGTVYKNAAPGSGATPADMVLNLKNGFGDLESLGGYAIAINPDTDPIAVAGKKWTGTKGITDLSVTFTAASGLFKGTMNVYCRDANGKVKKVKAQIYGASVNGEPYGTLVIKNVGSWGIQLSNHCGGSGEGC